MISAFVSRDFGYGYNLTPQQLMMVNEFQTKNGGNYIDEDAAKIVNNNIKKRSLPHHPLLLSSNLEPTNKGTGVMIISYSS